MPISRVVLNASPLICLFKSGLADLLPALFQEIIVPEAVINEVTAEGKTDFAAETLVSRKWIHRMADISIDSLVAAWDLGEGESAVLSFSLKNRDYWAVMDDQEARRCALSLRCRFIGTLGIIILAKKRGIIKSVRESMKKLQDAGFWLSVTLMEEICRRTGEE